MTQDADTGRMDEPNYQSECEQMLVDAIEALRALNAAVWTDHPAWAITRPETAKASEAVATYETWSRTPELNDGSEGGSDV